MRKRNVYRAGLAASTLLGFTIASATFSTVAKADSVAPIGPPFTTFQTTDNSKDILLTQGSPTFSPDLSTGTSFLANVYSIVGYGSGAVGTADVLQQPGTVDNANGDGIPSPYFMVGRNANGEIGTVVYKFVLPSGYVTGAGANVNANVYFRAAPHPDGAHEYIGVNSDIAISSNDVEITDINDFSKLTMESVFAGNTVYNSYFQNGVSLAIPAGLSQFYVVVADDADATDGRFAVSSLSINGAVTATPEPASLALLGGLAALSIRRRSIRV